MPRPYDLSAVRRCPASWDAMVPVPGEPPTVRECPGCARQVHDLRRLSDRALASTWAAGPVCGVYTRRQLRRGGAVPPEPSRLRTLAATVGVALGLPAVASAQADPDPTAVLVEDGTRQAEASPDPTTLRGMVRSVQGEGLLGAAVRLDTSLAVVDRLVAAVTDAHGRFEVDLRDLWAADPTLDTVSVRVQYLGTTVAERTVSLAALPDDLAIEVDMASARVEGLAVALQSHRSVYAVYDPEPEPRGVRRLWRWLKGAVGL